jgi:integrase
MSARGTVIKRGKSWSVVLDLGRDDAGRRLRRWHSGFKTKSDAEKARTRLLGDLDAGTYVEPNKVTVKSFFEVHWLPSVAATLRPTTLAMYEMNAKAHILPELGGIRLVQLTPSRLNAFYANRLSAGRRQGEGGLSSRTVRILHVILHRALSDAVRWGLLVRNVAELADPPKVQTREMKAWPPEDTRRFLDSVRSDRLHALWRLSATTGMRRGEILGLRWRDIDFEASSLTVCQTLVVVRYRPTFSEPKTAAGKRTLALDPETLTALRSHRRRQAEERLSWGSEWRGAELDLAFVRENGSPIHPERLSSWFNQRVAAAELPRINYHGLRHSYITMLLRAGQPLRVVSQRAGHSSPNVTSAVYAHVLPGDDEAAATVGAQILGDAG